MVADTRKHPGTQGWSHATRDRLTRWMLITVDGFVAVTALAGGVALASGLEDDNLGLELLEATPFESYLWPGVALVTTVGASSAIATLLTVRRHRMAGATSLLAGTLLAGWIGVEIALLEQPSEPTTTEVIYLVAAALMLGLGSSNAVRAARARSAGEPR